MQAIIKTSLATNDNHKRSWSFAKAIVQLGTIEELETAQAIIDADNTLRERAFSGIAQEIELRQRWKPDLHRVDYALAKYPRVARRAKNNGYKIALLAFSEFCSCDVDFACQQLEGVIKEFESGVVMVERHCGCYAAGQWPKNHLASVLAAMAMFTQRPCWVLRHLFLPDLVKSSMRNWDTVVFQRK